MTLTSVLWGGTSEAPCLLDAFVQQVHAHPAELAVSDEHGNHSYLELSEWVAQLQVVLREAQVQADEVVAVTGPRGAANIATFLAVLGLGATYLPLDPTYPPARLQHMLADSGARVLMHTGELPGLDVTRLAVVPVPDRGEDSQPIVTAACCADRACYLIYTSGSTGRPKGVAIGHRCLDSMAHWQVHHSPAPRLRTAQFAPLNFDVYFQEVLGTLCGGGSVLVMPEDLRRDPYALAGWVIDRQVERMFLPYVALQMLALTVEAEPELGPLPLVEINVAGEQLVCTTAIRGLFRDHPRCRLVNHYGQSESAMVTAHILAGDPSTWVTTPPIGTPLPGCELLIDSSDPDEPSRGELLVLGVPTSLGYLHAPELNRERYVDVRQTPHGHTRAFRTGDLVSLSAGTLTCHGRIDDEVKIAGIRVGLPEVDAALLDHPGVRGAATALVGPAAHRALRAAITVDNTAVAVDEVLQSLADRLPDVFLPRSVHVVEAIPTTPSGKIDRQSVARLLESATASGTP